MAFARPTLAQIVDRVQTDFTSKLELTSALLRRAVIYVLSRVIAGAVHMLHGHLEYLGKQLFPDQSDDEFLVRQAGLFGLTKTPATYATADVTATGTNGSIIPEGSLLVSTGGYEYAVDADATIASGTAAITVTALVAGSASTLVDGAVLSFESPISGVDASATVSDATADGSDEETTEELRVRLLERMAEPPHGGTNADYVAWCKEVSGVTRVWVIDEGLGPGTVLAYGVRDDDAPGSIIPDAGEITAVQDYVDALRPAHAHFTFAAPAAAAVDFEITITPDTLANRAAVEAEIADLFLRYANPLDGQVIPLTAVATAIGDVMERAAPGSGTYLLTAPVADIGGAQGELPTVGNFTWS